MEGRERGWGGGNHQCHVARTVNRMVHLWGMGRGVTVNFCRRCHVARTVNRLVHLRAGGEGGRRYVKQSPDCPADELGMHEVVTAIVISPKTKIVTYFLRVNGIVMRELSLIPSALSW